jgi:hypothetical protein
MQNSRTVLNIMHPELINKICSNAIPVRAFGGPQGCETSRRPHFLDNRLTHGDEVVSLTLVLRHRHAYRRTQPPHSKLRN